MSDKRPWSEAKSYTISFWGENPTQDDNLGTWKGNDTCWMAGDFASEKEARLAMADLDAHFHKSHRDCPYILLDGPNGLHEITCRTDVLKRVQRKQEDDNRAWQREIAMEAGMGMGVHAYNDAMGYDSEPYNPEDY